MSPAIDLTCGGDVDNDVDGGDDDDEDGEDVDDGDGGEDGDDDGEDGVDDGDGGETEIGCSSRRPPQLEEHNCCTWTTPH